MPGSGSVFRSNMVLVQMSQNLACVVKIYSLALQGGKHDCERVVPLRQQLDLVVGLQEVKCAFVEVTPRGTPARNVDEPVGSSKMMSVNWINECEWK